MQQYFSIIFFFSVASRRAPPSVRWFVIILSTMREHGTPNVLVYTSNDKFILHPPVKGRIIKCANERIKVIQKGNEIR